MIKATDLSNDLPSPVLNWGGLRMFESVQARPGCPHICVKGKTMICKCGGTMWTYQKL